MYNSIILSSCLFGSFYMFSQSLGLINRSKLENKQLLYKLSLLNGLTFLFSGSVIMYSFKCLKI